MSASSKMRVTQREKKCHLLFLAHPTVKFLAASRNSLPTISITVVQSPRFCWRNSRIVGYQGLSLRFVSQRQSARNGSRIQTGLPIPAARSAPPPPPPLPTPPLPLHPPPPPTPPTPP